MEIRTQAVNFDADTKLIEFIDKKLGKLETFYDNIVSTDVFLKLEKTGQVQDKVAEIKLKVPGSTLVVKETSKSFEESVDLGASSLRRQLIKYKDKKNN
ncbi:MULTISPECIES: ribosome hibernation-promoting factor, HPF/YfiA family [unclassified Aureispira]|uniref:ribosome hibernation-promoting factor, HPF/YfiA family n=1 Tax=unclassified Aureispira TaxID=2649989 RepID=UPI0006961577|nr:MULTISPECIES: ribosome-associated translation inhibitor RaiA [unclassified Aureispira]WMX14742.1 ribosome-associated translation inhibitor RaiA [Aureispira sp. CCB-E]